MAFGNATFTGLAGGVHDIFSAEATKIKSEGQANALRMKATGSRLQADQFDRSAKFSDLNAELSLVNADLKGAAAERAAFLGIGQQQADIAGAGFSEGGSAEDLLRDSMTQASLQRSVIEFQGLVEEAGYREQATAYRTSAEVSRLSATSDDMSAQYILDAGEKEALGAYISGGLKIAGSIATLAF